METQTYRPPADDHLLFEWLRRIDEDPRITRAVGATLRRMALSGDATSGRNCRLNEDEIADALGISRRSLYRHLNSGMGLGYLRQTHKPTLVRKGKGRMARYEICFPTHRRIRYFSAEDLAAISLPVNPSRVPDLRVVVAHDNPESRVPAPGGNVAHDNPSRVPLSAESCDSTTPDAGTLPTSVGPTFGEDSPTPAPPTLDALGLTASDIEQAKQKYPEVDIEDALERFPYVASRPHRPVSDPRTAWRNLIRLMAREQRRTA
jgi:hypothetical protein